MGGKGGFKKKSKFAALTTLIDAIGRGGIESIEYSFRNSLTSSPVRRPTQGEIRQPG